MQPTLVAGTGVAGPRRSIVPDQDVRRGLDAPTRRTWRPRATGGGRYGGTLSDATGPATGEVTEADSIWVSR